MQGVSVLSLLVLTRQEDNRRVEGTESTDRSSAAYLTSTCHHGDAPQ